MKVVIIGAEFGGLTAAKELIESDLEIILVDKNNHHLFQPLLYQVAVSALSPGDIAYPIRTIFRKSRNIETILGKVSKVDLVKKSVLLESSKEFNYDYLILAPGSITNFFGRKDLESNSMKLKSLADALNIREKILASFENAELLNSIEDKKEFLTFVVVGGGPTGVELAGSLAELIEKTILPDFKKIKKSEIKIILIDSGKQLLSTYPAELSEYALVSLKKLGVEVILDTRVLEIDKNVVLTDKNETIKSLNIFWTAGNRANPLLETLGVKIDYMGRVIVSSDLSIPGYPNVFVIGDSACFIDENGYEIPGIAPGAIQEGKYVARIIKERIPEGERPRFEYRDKGILATIGKARAVAMLKDFRFKGFFAWLVWSFIHIFFLIGFRNRLRVMLEWIWYYLTNKSGARLIVQREFEEN
ncbi:MAG: NAD(P)/FAD-dependent oxidoreductase [Candidatus Kapaibacteriales bacterium]